MMGNLKGLAKYLPKDSKAMVHNFPTITLCTGPWHSSQPVDFFFSTDPGKHPFSNPSLSTNIPNHSGQIS